MGGRKGSGVRVSCWWNSIKSANLPNWRKLSTIAKSKDGFQLLLWQFRMEKSRNVDVFCRTRTCRYVFRESFIGRHVATALEVSILSSSATEVSLPILGETSWQTSITCSATSEASNTSLAVKL